MSEPTDTGAPEDVLSGLDEAQREVATSFGQPVAVLAGAGSGKTRALSHRIAYGVATAAYSPQKIMALTFTTKAAGEMRSRIEALGVRSVQARTFHSAALSQLNYFWPKLTGQSAPKVLATKARTIAEVAAAAKLPLDQASARDVASEIEWRKVRGLGIDRYTEELTLGRRTPPGRLSIEQAVTLHTGYQALLESRRQIDFEDVLLLTAGMLHDEPAMIAEVHEQYRHFLVDEFQDVSPVQFELLRLWLGERSDLCVVGDASQTIYSFAGASSYYLLEFEREFPGGKVIRLERNYRSTPEIVARANALMRGRAGALQLEALAEPGAEPELWLSETEAAAAARIAEDIAVRVANGESPDEMCVLFRINAQSQALETALRDRGIGYRVRGGLSYFDRPELKQALMQLRAEALSSPSGRPLVPVVTDVVRGLGWTPEPPPAAGALRDRWEALDVLAQLAEAAAGQSVREFADEMARRAEHGIEPDQGAVTLATIHSAKGLEWERVYLFGVSEGSLPLSLASGLEAIDEERRLMYVAITRARRALVAVAAKSGERGPREPSRFLRESGIGSLGAAPPRSARASRAESTSSRGPQPARREQTPKA